MMRRPAPLFIMMLIITVMGCGRRETSTSQLQPKPKRVLSGAHDLAANDSKRPRSKLAPPEPKLRTLASVGDCAPKSENQLAVASCFDNKPCRGQWIRADAGQVACSCFGKSGGCKEDEICCSVTHRCEKIQNCYFP